MPRGRPPKPGSAAEKAAARREQVRANVQALRARRKQQAVELKKSQATSIVHPSHVDFQLVDIAHTETAGDETNGIKVSAQSRASGPETIMINHNGRWFPFFQSLDSGNAYAVALLGHFRESFLPDSVHMPTSIVSVAGQRWDSQEFLWTPCAFWVTTAFTKAACTTSSALRNILLGIGIALKFMEYRDPVFEVTSLQLYRKCLRSIRLSLAIVSQPGGKRKVDASELYLTCHAAAMFELMQNSDLRGTLRHLHGVSMLIEYLGDGPDAVDQSIPLLLLQDYRMVEMAFCLRFRYESKMSVKTRLLRKRQAKNVQDNLVMPAALQLETCSMMIGITDIADAICAVMVEFDRLRAMPADKSVIPALVDLLDELGQIWIGYGHMTKQLLAKRGSIFVDLSVSGLPLRFDVPKPFVSFEVGVAWNYKLLSQLYALDESIEIMILLQRLISAQPLDEENGKLSAIPEPRELECRLAMTRRKFLEKLIEATKCVFYFLQTDKGITGQTLGVFPLDASSNMLKKELIRLELDLAKLRANTSDSVNETEAVKSSIAVVTEALKFCGEMQQRAAQFGLPTVYD